MTIYDFVVTNRQVNDAQIKLTVEKVAVLNDDVTLAQWLKENGVDDKEIGQAIEQLEGLPYGSKTALANNHILIEQI